MVRGQFGEFGGVLERLELAFGERIVVGDVGSAVGFGDGQAAQQLGHGLGRHGRSAIAVDGQLLWADLLTLPTTAKATKQGWCHCAGVIAEDLSVPYF